MRKLFLILVLYGLCIFILNAQHKENAILIDWVDDLKGDFSFDTQWNYPEGIYVNEYGQVSCDGFCPEEVLNMKDENGKIFIDSLHSFYKWVDTSHQFVNMMSETNMYEFAGAPYLNVEIQKNGNFNFYTLSSPGTHCSLYFKMDKNKIYPFVELNSIVKSGKLLHFPLLKGSIKIDKKNWENGYLRASFDFEFENKLEANEPIFWKGLINFALPQK